MLVKLISKAVSLVDASTPKLMRQPLSHSPKQPPVPLADHPHTPTHCGPSMPPHFHTQHILTCSC